MMGKEQYEVALEMGTPGRTKKGKRGKHLELMGLSPFQREKEKQIVR